MTEGKRNAAESTSLRAEIHATDSTWEGWTAKRRAAMAEPAASQPAQGREAWRTGSQPRRGEGPWGWKSPFGRLFFRFGEGTALALTLVRVPGHGPREGSGNPGDRAKIC